jgi:hypothetical protein
MSITVTRPLKQEPAEPILRYRRPAHLPAWCADCEAPLVDEEAALCAACEEKRRTAPAYLPPELEQSEDWSILRSYLEALAAASPAAIVRIVTADRLEMWLACWFCDEAGRRCLVGHAEDWRSAGGTAQDGAALAVRYERAHLPVEEAFDTLARRFGLSILVPAVREEASRYL